MTQQITDKPAGAVAQQAPAPQVDTWSAELPARFSGVAQGTQVAWSRAGQIAETAMRAPHNGVPLSELPPDVARAVLAARAEAMAQYFETIVDGIIAVARDNVDAHRRDQITKELLMPRFRRMAQGTRDRVATSVIGNRPGGDNAVTEPDPRGVTQKPESVVADAAAMCTVIEETVPEQTPAICGPLTDGSLDLSGQSTNRFDPLVHLTPNNPNAVSVDLTGSTVGQPQVGPTRARAAQIAQTESNQVRESGPLFVEHGPGADRHETVRAGLTQRLGYVPHRDVVALVAEHAQTREDGRLVIPDRAAIIAMYAETYGIDTSQGQVIIARENDRYADVIERSFHFGEGGVPDWGARGLLIRTIMTMNGLQPRHNVEMPGVVVIPANEADFATLALAENGFAGQETQRFAGETVEPAKQVETAAAYLLRLRGQDPSDPTLLAAAHAEVEEMLANPSHAPSAAGTETMRAYARTEADRANWPRDAVLEAYKDLFDHPDFKDVPRDRLAAMIMMTVAQTNNLDAESFAGCSQLLFVNSERMASLIRDAASGDATSHFAALDAMVADIDTLQGMDRATAEVWQSITQEHAPGSGQVARRLLDGRPMPMVLIDSAAAMQPLSQEDMQKVLGLLGASAYIREGIESPGAGILGFFGTSLSGFVAMARVYGAAVSDPNQRLPGESLLDWSDRMNPDRSDAARGTFRRQLERAQRLVQPVLDELAAAGSGSGWSWENGRLHLEDASAYRATVEAMNLSPKSRQLLLLWLDTKFEGRDVSGPVTVDVEKLGALHIINNFEPRRSSGPGIHTVPDALPTSYYTPKKGPDYYEYPTSLSTGTYELTAEENKGFIESIKDADLSVVAAQHSSEQARLRLANQEIKEAATELRAFIADLQSDNEKYQVAITLMNNAINRWEASGRRGSLTGHLLQEVRTL